MADYSDAYRSTYVAPETTDSKVNRALKKIETLEAQVNDLWADYRTKYTDDEDGDLSQLQWLKKENKRLEAELGLMRATLRKALGEG